MTQTDIIALAKRHGLQITEDIHFNEMGIDFSVGFATDVEGKKWVLRIPRRSDMEEQILKEQNILHLAKTHLSIAVPDWKIVSNDLIAYPLLEDQPTLTFDAETYEVTWNIDPNNSNYISSLAEVLVELHGVPEQAATDSGVKSVSNPAARQEVLDNIDRVKKELGIGPDLERRWRQWVDNDSLWPDFTVFVHGDLYAGHVLCKGDGQVTGIIDWSEGHLGDPSIDFSGHISAFGEDSLRNLIGEYGKKGGKMWDGMFQQTVERHAAAPLKYAIFALTTDSDVHINAVKNQLGLG